MFGEQKLHFEPGTYLQGARGGIDLPHEKFCMALPPEGISNLEIHIGK